MRPAEAFAHGYRRALEEVERESEAGWLTRTDQQAAVRLAAKRVRRRAEAMDEYRDYGRPVEVTGQDGTRVRGEVWRTLESSEGRPVYEVCLAGRDFSIRVPGRERIEFLDTGEVVEPW